MKVLKIVLHSKAVIIIFLLLFISYLFFSLSKSKVSVYDGSEKEFTCTILSYSIKEDYLNSKLMCDEKVVGVLYFNSLEEVDGFNNTYELDDLVSITGSLERFEGNRNINLFNAKKYYEAYDILYKLKIKKISLIKKHSGLSVIKNNLYKRVNSLESKDYIESLVFGNKSYLDEEVLESFKNISIMHMFAVSGMHINIIINIVNGLFKKKSKVKDRIIAFIIFLYYLLVKSISIERAFISYLIDVLNSNYDLNINRYYKIILVIIIMLIINPRYLYLSSFYFSIIISSFLILVSDKIKNQNIIYNTFIVSLYSFIVSLPLIGYYYNEVNILSVLFNTLVSILISVIIFPLCLITIVIPIFDIPLSMILNIFEIITSYFSMISIKVVLRKDLLFVIIYYLLLFFFLKKKSFILFYLLLFFVHMNYNYIFPSNYVYFFDVGQGDSILISLNNKNILIDTGGRDAIKKEDFNKKNNYISKNITIPVLKSLGISRLDYLIITHGDFDHMGDAINVIDNYRVDNVIFNCGMHNELEGELISKLDTLNINYYSCINELNIDSYKLLFLKTRIYDNENDNSNVIYLKIDDYRFLFMGDAEKSKEIDLINKFNLSKIDILKAGHHGSNTSSNKEFIDKINPKYSIISVGKNNKYGHPNKEVLNNLQDSKIYRTDIDGGILFTIKNSMLQIKICNP